MTVLAYNRLAAARALSKIAPYSRLSAEKSEFLLGARIDVSRSLDVSDDEDDEGLGTSRVTRRREQQRVRRIRRNNSGERMKALNKYMDSTSTTFREFEGFLVALDALETWADVADQLKK